MVLTQLLQVNEGWFSRGRETRDGDDPAQTQVQPARRSRARRAVRAAGEFGFAARGLGGYRKAARPAGRQGRRTRLTTRKERR